MGRYSRYDVPWGSAHIIFKYLKMKELLLYCNNCRKNTPVDFKFCPTCGSPALESDPTRTIQDSNSNPNHLRPNDNSNNVIMPFHSKRPLGIKLIAIFSIIIGIMSNGIVILSTLLNFDLVIMQLVISVIPLSIATLCIVTGYGMLKRIRFSRYLAIFLAIVNIGGYIIIFIFVSDHSVLFIYFLLISSFSNSYPSIAISLFIIFVVINIMVLDYMQIPRIKAYFKK